MKWLADENIPHNSYFLLHSKGFDIKHISFENPSTIDKNVLQIAIDEGRILLTFDSDFGTLVFKDGLIPLGIIYYRLTDFLPDEPANILLELLSSGLYKIEHQFTVIDADNIRQRPIPKP